MALWAAWSQFALNARRSAEDAFASGFYFDGFIATENDSLDWLFPLGDLDDSSYPELIAEVGDLAMGSATLGQGKPLFPRRVLPPVLRLVSVRQMGAGMAELRYEVHQAGPSGTA